MNLLRRPTRWHERRRRTRNKNKRLSIRAQSRSFDMECLEARILLTSTWDGGGDGKSWNDGLNWDGDVIPTINDDAIITLRYRIQDWST